MTRTLAAVAAVLLSLATPASAHRLDEYLEAALVSIEKGQVYLSLRLIPGVAVSSAVISSIDINEDGLLSKSEQQNYASTVLRDLSLSIDGHPLQPHLVSVAFPTIEEMKEGLAKSKSSSRRICLAAARAATSSWKTVTKAESPPTW